uniref:Uncharacterized protein n=1 Tax=Lepeophtheirus salmonis TaxID=72036 RepID=A0A0K2VEX5_LEPSM
MMVYSGLTENRIPFPNA